MNWETVLAFSLRTDLQRRVGFNQLALVGGERQLKLFQLFFGVIKIDLGADLEVDRIVDVEPSLIRAQALADPVRVPRAIVRAKLAASATHADAIDQSKWSSSLDRARTVPEIVTIEARIAASYWRAFATWAFASVRGKSPAPTDRKALGFSALAMLRIPSTPCSITPTWSRPGGWRER